MTTFTGQLTFHSETGTEGGYWALQDERFITRVSPEYGVFSGCVVYDPDNPERQGVTTGVSLVRKGDEWLTIPDPIQGDEDYFSSSLFRGSSGDRDADRRLAARYGFRIIYSDEQWDEKWGAGNWHYEDDGTTAVGPDGERYISSGIPHTDPQRPYGVGHGELTVNTVHWEDGSEERRQSDSLLVSRWSYEGLKILEDGDSLVICDKDDPNEILWQGKIQLRQHKLFTEHAFGMWIHADQIGIERETWARWFLDGYPARLTRTE